MTDATGVSPREIDAQVAAHHGAEAMRLLNTCRAYGDSYVFAELRRALSAAHEAGKLSALRAIGGA